MNAPKPKDVLPLAQEITKLEAQLAEAKRKWNALFGVEESEKRTRNSSASGLTGKILKYVEDNPGKELNISTVSRAVDEGDLAVGRTLYRLSKLGKIANPSRGFYSAIDKEETAEKSLK
jgi:hypothetical protein